MKCDSGNAVACLLQSWIDWKIEEVKMMRCPEEYDKQRKLGWQKQKKEEKREEKGKKWEEKEQRKERRKKKLRKEEENEDEEDSRRIENLG